MKKEKVKIVEVGLRDGLQNEDVVLKTETKIEIAEKLILAGVKHIEIGAFVSAKRVPQMADTNDVIFQLQKNLEPKVQLSALVPNQLGMELAIQSGIKEVAIFAACSESFSKANINCTIDESYERFEPVIKLAKKYKIKIRGYLSTCFGCPFEGEVSEKFVIDQIRRMDKLGAYEISIGDTIGVAHAGQVESLFKKVKRHVPVKKLAGHFHDTRGQALANVLAAYRQGVRVFDSSLGGLGGCPYAPSATGNVSTEDLLYMLNGMGANTGIDLQAIIDINRILEKSIGHELPSRVGNVGFLKKINP